MGDIANYRVIPEDKRAAFVGDYKEWWSNRLSRKVAHVEVYLMRGPLIGEERLILRVKPNAVWKELRNQLIRLPDEVCAVRRALGKGWKPYELFLSPKEGGEFDCTLDATHK